ncbi:hypothetical protein [Roseimaritima sediminicola]|nr:hypothetical protein [Roseimaritima sediminicola]
MSLPRNEIQTLLEEYLDDALKGERLSALEAAIKDDPWVADQLQRLRDERALRLRAMREDPRLGNAQLPPQFTQRVMKAALAAAAAETANEASEPLHDSRSASSGERPTNRTASVDSASRVARAFQGDRDLQGDRTGAAGSARFRRRRWLRPLSGSVGVAAAVLIVAMLIPGSNDPDELTQAGSGAVDPENVDLENLDPENLDPKNLDPKNLDPENLAPENLVQVMEEVPLADPAPEPEPNRLETADPAPAASSDSPRIAANTLEQPTPSPQPRAMETDLPATAPLGFVMVYEVTQTPEGAASRAVLGALTSAGIEVAARREVSEQVVGYLRDAKLVAAEDASPEADRAEILYIEASGKALDQFMVSLFADTDNVAQLRWNMAIDPPLSKAVQNLQQVHPASVQHSADASTAWPLVSEQGERADFTLSPERPPLMPLERDGWNGMASASQGPDIRSQLILLIR